MKVYNTSFTLSTDEQTEISDITKLVRDAVQQFAVTTGIALVNTLHTTCALFVNEFQSALIDDLRSLVERLVPPADGQPPAAPPPPPRPPAHPPPPLRAPL